MQIIFPLRIIVSLWALFWLAGLTGVAAFLAALMSMLKTRESAMQWVPRLWAKLLIRGIGCPVRVKGRENLTESETYVFASNHTSALDIPALLSVLPANFRWIAKKELFEIPVFGPALRRVGYIPIDRSNNRSGMQSLIAAAQRISAGASVVIFPEGTRSAKGLLPFKPGGLALAIRSGRPVIPVAILGASQALPPKKYIVNPGTIEVRLGAPIPTSGLKMKDRDQLTEQVRDRVAELLGAG